MTELLEEAAQKDESLETNEEHLSIPETKGEKRVLGIEENLPEMATLTKTDNEVPPPLEQFPTNTDQVSIQVSESIVGDGNILAKDVHARHIQIIGQQTINQQTEQRKRKRAPFLYYPPTEWREKIETVFVASAEYRQFVANIKNGQIDINKQRVYFIYGAENAGKFSFALRLGLDISQAQGREIRILLYRHFSDDMISILDAILDPDLGENTVYIFQDILQNNADLRYYSLENLNLMQEVLFKKNSYLILTSTVPDGLATLHPTGFEAKVENLTEVLEKHLTYYRNGEGVFHIHPTLIDLVLKHKEKFVVYLETPSQIDHFCRDLSQQSPVEATEETIQRLAERLQMSYKQPSLWFQTLKNLNQRLYAMLVVLFRGSERVLLEELYTEAVRKLRADGVVKLVDPRQIGRDDLLQAIQAYETEEGYVRFNSPLFEREALRQIRNHHHLLWSLINLLLELVEQLQASRHWELRRDLGSAIGQLGVHNLNELRTVLDALAQHPAGGVSVVAGYALNEISLLNREYHPFVIQLLEQWSHSGHPDLTWTASAAIWRVYDTFVKQAITETPDDNDALTQLNRQLKHLAQNFDHFSDAARLKALSKALEETSKGESISLLDILKPETAQKMRDTLNVWAESNASAVTHAVWQIASTNAEQIVKEVIDWLSTRSSLSLYGIAQRACRNLFSGNVLRKEQSYVLVPERHQPLLKLLFPFWVAQSFWNTKNPSLQPIHQSANDTIMHTLQTWAQVDDQWREWVLKALLETINRATSEVNYVLRQALTSIWLSSSDEIIRQMGLALIGRIYAVDGVPMTMPQDGFGIIVTDGSYEARLDNQGSRWARRLFARFNAQVDTYILQMGSFRHMVRPQDAVETSYLAPHYDLSRLLCPTIEECKLPLDQAIFILVMTWGRILDLDDTLAQMWSDKLVVAPMQTLTSKWPDGLKLVEYPTNEASIEIMVREQVVTSLAQRDRTRWQATLGNMLDTEKDIADVLHSWLDELDSIDFFQQEYDTARKIVCAVLWLASADFPRCLTLLRTWLIDAGNPLRVRMGATCSQALYYLYAHAQISAETHGDILTLAPLLTQSDYKWDYAQAMLYAARRWVAKRNWLRRLTTHPEGGTSEFFQLLESLLPDKHQALNQLLETWQGQCDPEKQEDEMVKHLIEQIQLRIALGMSGALPDLQEGHVYGLIIVDLSSRNRIIRADLSQLTSDILEELRKSSYDAIHPLTYQMGYSTYIAAVEDEPILPQLEATYRRPCLLTPILELFDPDKIGFVLLLANASAIDQDDWQESDWRERIVVFTLATDMAWAEPFRVIHKPNDIKVAPQKIARQLLNIVGD